MPHHSRYLQNQIIDDALAAQKIAFVSGPRQVGKTTMAEAVLSQLNQEQNYFSWDDDEFRKVWTKGPKEMFEKIEKGACVVLDEVHKDRKWKSKLKGLFDLYKRDLRFVVTGSARLDFYRKSGDSLQGRYIPYRLHPFSSGEESRVKPPPSEEWDDHFVENYPWRQLLQLGGFPEPFFLQSQEKAKRWQRLYRERMIREDLRDLQEVRDVRIIESLALLLQDRAGSQLSYESLREDLSVSFDSIRRWIDLLEALFYCYRIRPFSTNVKRSLKKEPKLFLYDWSLVSSEGSRLENMVAGHLLKSCHAWTDCAFGEFDLFYLRDKQKREVDFLVTKDRKPFALIEVKSGQATPTHSLLYFQSVLKPKFCLQIVRDEKHERAKMMEHPGVRIISTKKFLGSLV